MSNTLRDNLQAVAETYFDGFVNQNDGIEQFLDAVISALPETIKVDNQDVFGGGYDTAIVATKSLLEEAKKPKP